MGNRVIITGHDARQLRFTGLKIESGLIIAGIWKNPTAAYQELRFYVNGDYLDAHWVRQGLASTGHAVSGDELPKSQIAASPPGGTTCFTLTMYHLPTGEVFVESREIRNGSLRLYGCAYSELALKITQVDLISTSGEGIGIGSLFEYNPGLIPGEVPSYVPEDWTSWSGIVQPSRNIG